MRAFLHLQLTDAAGAVVAERHAHNTVMIAGAQLVASLFSGEGSPISHMAVGTSSSTPDDVTVTTLANGADGGDPLTGDVMAPIAAESFSSRVIEELRLVQVRVRGTLPATAAVGTIREAGLVSAGGAEQVLYNRVVFAPLVKGDDHELTLFWDVDFPFGDLQWMA